MAHAATDRTDRESGCEAGEAITCRSHTQMFSTCRVFVDFIEQSVHALPLMPYQAPGGCLATHESEKYMAGEHAKDLVAVAREYFVRADAGRSDTLDLFTENIEIYFPKFGVRRGHDGFGELARGIMSSVERLSHDIGGMAFKVIGSTVFVEGLTQGATRDGREWVGGSRDRKSVV